MKTNIITTAVFCILIGGLSLASLFAPVKESSETENRELAQMPYLTVKSFFSGKFAESYEEFITDQFVGRDGWIAVKTTSDRLIGKRESKDIYFSDDGYFIDGSSPDSEQLEKNLAALEAFANDLDGKYNVRVMIAPTASLILADKLPYGAPVWEQNSFLDAVAELPGALDIRQTLLEHSDGYIYYRTDHHWTADGMYLAYRELCKSLEIEPLGSDELERTILSDSFFGTVIAKVGVSSEPDILTDLTSKNQPELHVTFNLGESEADSLYVNEKLSTRDKYGVYLGGNPALADITTSVKNGRVLVMAKDSYAHCMLPLLANHYERMIIIDLRSFNSGFESYLEKLKSDGVEVDDVVVLYNALGFANERSAIWLKK